MFGFPRSDGRFRLLSVHPTAQIFGSRREGIRVLYISLLACRQGIGRSRCLSQTGLWMSAQLTPSLQHTLVIPT